MKLHPVTHGPRKNRFCGPAALSAISGKLTDVTAKTLRDVSGRRSITGTTQNEMWCAAEALGFRLIPSSLSPRGVTLAEWLRRVERPEGRLFLVSAGNHWVVISGRRFVCGRTGEIVDFKHPKVKRRARVKATFIVVEASHART